MELLLTLLVLYALQCVVLLPCGSALFLRPLRGWQRSEGPGWRLTHPLPSAPGWIGARLPLVEDESGFRSRGVTPRLGASTTPHRSPRLEPGRGQEVEVRGALLRVDGRPFLRAVSKEHAKSLGELIGSLAREGEAAWPRLEQELVDSFCVEGVRADHVRLETATRWLGRLSDTSFFALFLVLPGLVWWVHPERALLLFLPAYGLLHAATVTALFRAHRSLFPKAAGDRVEQTMGAALYPPLLLRAQQELRAAVLGRFHPAAIATVLLPRDAALDLLRGELARTQQPSGGREASQGGLARCEHRLLSGLAQKLGTTAEALLAPPLRRDALARSHCPVCLAEYRLESGRCSDCGVPLRAFTD